MHCCLICFSDLPGTQFKRIPGCRHSFCEDCMGTHCALHVKEGTLDQLVCPDTSCRDPLPAEFLREVLPEEDFARWERLSEQQTMDSQIGTVYCPSCDTATTEGDGYHAQCPSCMFNFCSLCQTAWHPGTECLTPEGRLRLLQARAAGPQATSAARAKEATLQNEIMARHYVMKNAKQCPTCKMAIEKSEGCNKMTCRNCNSYFCYKCGKTITGYEHFKEGGTCMLFDLEQIRLWEDRFNAMAHQQIMIDAHMHLNPGNVQNLVACPNCRQQSVKANNNNHLRCWSCNQHFCFLCRSMIKGTNHFSRKGCRQHSS
ncbi:hypothetical protein CYMTET_32739 [Cymbomonas tetramitiformis]|uniref:RBR-type E3 ubiquitin transferase n=1 Tax=Cymbomonas tetramitiformis TaxID=36881 RepID=A0AAE0FE80_9CHLO|nr:hypothetical protein CYMTET_32739 [Cymbomonas tetramitiformis]